MLNIGIVSPASCDLGIHSLVIHGRAQIHLCAVCYECLISNIDVIWNIYTIYMYIYTHGTVDTQIQYIAIVN